MYQIQKAGRNRPKEQSNITHSSTCKNNIKSSSCKNIGLAFVEFVFVSKRKKRAK